MNSNKVSFNYIKIGNLPPAFQSFYLTTTSTYNSFAIDKDDNIWISTTDGIAKVAPNGATILTVNEDSITSYGSFRIDPLDDEFIYVLGSGKIMKMTLGGTIQWISSLNYNGGFSSIYNGYAFMYLNQDGGNHVYYSDDVYISLYNTNTRSYEWSRKVYDPDDNVNYLGAGIINTEYGMYMGLYSRSSSSMVPYIYSFDQSQPDSSELFFSKSLFFDNAQSDGYDSGTSMKMIGNTLYTAVTDGRDYYTSSGAYEYNREVVLSKLNIETGSNLGGVRVTAFTDDGYYSNVYSRSFDVDDEGNMYLYVRPRVSGSNIPTIIKYDSSFNIQWVIEISQNLNSGIAYNKGYLYMQMSDMPIISIPSDGLPSQITLSNGITMTPRSLYSTVSSNSSSSRYTLNTYSTPRAFETTSRTVVNNGSVASSPSTFSNLSFTFVSNKTKLDL